jgi:hypothetical protein
MGGLHQELIKLGENPGWEWGKLAPQHHFLTSSDQFTMFSGGFGTGKTSSLCAKVVGLLTYVPGNLGYLGRKDGKALRQTTVLFLLDEMIPKDWIARHDVQKGILTLVPEIGGSTLIYGDFKDTGDLKNHNLGFFAIDQTEEIEWNIWEFLAGRLRRKVPIVDQVTGKYLFWVGGYCEKSKKRHFAVGRDSTQCVLCGKTLVQFSDKPDKETKTPPWDIVIYPRFGFGVCNTEGPDHWIFEKFSGLPGPQNNVSKGLPGYTAFHATTYDALAAGFVDKEYVAALETTYSANPLMYKRYLLGEWVVAEGLVFPEFKRDLHIIHEDSVRPDGQPLLESWLPVQEYIDPGITAPTAVGWVVVEHCTCGCNKPNFYLIDEHYVANPTPEYHCHQIKQHREELKRHVISTEMDSQSFSKTNIQKLTESNESRLYSVADLYITEGVYVRRNQKDRVAGRAIFSQLLNIDPDHKHPITGEFGAPHFFVFSRNTHFIDEISIYKWKEQKEEPIDKNDHHMNGIVSFMNGRPEYRIGSPPIVDTRTDFQKDLEDELDELTGQHVIDFMEM